MVRKARRGRFAPRAEALESRTLLSSSTDLVSFEAISQANPDSSRTLIVRFAEDLSPRITSGILDRLGAEVVRSIPEGPIALAFPSEANRDATLALLRNRPWVVYAEPDAPLLPSGWTQPETFSQHFPQLWGLSNAVDTDIDAPEAWSSTAGGSEVIVAVLDTGIDLNHPDFSGRVWVNPRETFNGQDDDGNGFVDDIFGWNFVSNTNNVQDDNGHGSHVSGTIAANANLSVGVVGVSPSAKIMPLKVLDAQGGGTTSAAVDAIYYAVRNGAQVINASWGGPGRSNALAEAIRFAESRAVFVSAAGNAGTNNDSSRTPSYPANYRFSNTISVAAIGSDGRLASFSNYGATTVDVAAPGVGILSTVPGGYNSFSGTSMAAPHVAGIAALLASQFPQATPAQIVARIVQNTKPLAGNTSSRPILGGIASASMALGVNETPAPSDPNPTITVTQVPAEQTQIPPAQGSAPNVPQEPNAERVRAMILASDEAFFAQGGTNETFISAIYLAALERAPEPGAIPFWTERLQVGTPRLEVAEAILISTEGLRTKVARWYRDDLGRPGDMNTLKADSGVIAWADLLANGLIDDLARGSILGSEEYYNRQGATNSGFLNGLYAATLGRTIDQEGMALWTQRLAAGTQRFDLALEILSAEEPRRIRVAHWYRDDLRRPEDLQSLKFDPGVIDWAAKLPTA